MTLNLKKTGAIAFVAGSAVALSIEVIGRCLNAFNVHPGMWFSSALIFIWPTGLYLIGTSNNRAGYIAFALSAVANGLLYGLVAVLAHYTIWLVKD